MASPVTIQPATQDTYARENAPTGNYSTATYMQTYPLAATRNRMFLAFDFSASVPAGATITLANLSLYAYTVASGRTITAYRLLRTDWAKAQLTWNIYKTGASWGTAGALNTTNDPDFTATDEATAASLASAGWQSWDVKSQIQTALDSVSGIAHFLVADVGATANKVNTFYSSRYAVDTSLRPKLYIEYTVPSAVKPNFIPFFWA